MNRMQEYALIKRVEALEAAVKHFKARFGPGGILSPTESHQGGAGHGTAVVYRAVTAEHH